MYDDESKLRELIVSYKSSNDNNILDDIYICIKRLSKFIILKYYIHYFDDTSDIDNIVHNISTDLVIKICKENHVSIEAWTQYIKIYSRGYMPYKHKDHKNKSLSDIDIDTVVNCIDPEYSNKEFNLVIRRLIDIYIEEAKILNIYKDEAIFNISSYLALLSVFLEVDPKALKNKREGLYISSLNNKFKEILKSLYERS